MAEIFPETPIASLPAAVAFLGALPMKVGTVPQALSADRLTEIAARVQAASAGPWWTDTLAESDGRESIGVGFGDDSWIVPCQDLDPADAEFIAHARADVPALLTDNARLRARVAALLDERHSTNEALSEAAEALRVQRDRIAELEMGIAWRDAERDRWSGVHYLIEKAIDKGWSTLDTLDVEAELGPEAAPVPAESVAEPSCLCPPADQPGPHQVGCPQVALPLPGLREVPPAPERPVNELTAAFTPMPVLREVLDGEHYAYVHHEHRTPHDMPEMGGAS